MDIARVATLGNFATGYVASKDMKNTVNSLLNK